MTTKTPCFSSSKKNFFVRENSSNDQYSNLNLNQNHQCWISGDSDSFSKQTKTSGNKKATNYEKDIGLLYFDIFKVKKDSIRFEKKVSVDFSPKNNDSQRKSTSFSSLKKSSNYNIQSNGEKEKKKDGKNDDFEIAASKKSRSTLSLHIAAYENFVEGFSGSDSFIDNHENDKSDSLLKDKKQIFGNSNFITQNPFEFPRQQQPEIGIKPEISQFKASQILFNPNESASSSPEGLQISSNSNSQHSQHHGRNRHPKNHHHHRNRGGGHRSHHYHNNNNHHYQNLNNFGALDVIVHENKMFVPSMFHAAQETSLAITAMRYKQNEIEKQKALAMGRKLSSSSLQNNFSPPSSYQQNPAPTWLPLIQIIPFLTPQMQSEHAKDKKHQHNHNQQQQQHYHQQFQRSDDFFEGISSTLDDDNVFLPSGISPLKLDKNSSMKHVVSSNSFDLSPTNSSTPALSHSDTLSPNEQLHVPLDSIFHGTTKKFNKKAYRKRKAVVAGKAISLADLESRLIGKTEKEDE